MSYEHTISVRLKKEFESFSNELIFRHLQLITCHVAIFKFTWDLGLPVLLWQLLLSLKIMQASCRPHVRDICDMNVKHWTSSASSLPQSQFSSPFSRPIFCMNDMSTASYIRTTATKSSIDVTLLWIQRCSKTLAMSNLMEALLLIITVPWIFSSTNRMPWPVRRMNP